LAENEAKSILILCLNAYIKVVPKPALLLKFNLALRLFAVLAERQSVVDKNRGLENVYYVKRIACAILQSAIQLRTTIQAKLWRTCLTGF
jgi:hypothetical protein